MEILAAIDLLGGKVVRLTKGDPNAAKVYNTDPVGIARNWQAEGANGLHLVDLDAALGSGSNLSRIKEIITSVFIPVQIGGGIRSEASARELLSVGAKKVVLGTLALQDEACLIRLLTEFGERIIVALDFSRGKIMTHGWTQESQVSVNEALEKFSRLGVKQFLMTAIERDGTFAGPASDFYSRLRLIPGIEVIASGGISKIDDLFALKRSGVHAVVVGKALYEGKLTIRQIVEALHNESATEAPRRKG